MRRESDPLCLAPRKGNVRGAETLNKGPRFERVATALRVALERERASAVEEPITGVMMAQDPMTDGGNPRADEGRAFEETCTSLKTLRDSPPVHLPTDTEADASIFRIATP